MYDFRTLRPPYKQVVFLYKIKVKKMVGWFVISAIFIFCLKDGIKLSFEGLKKEGIKGIKKGAAKLKSGLSGACAATAALLWCVVDDTGSRVFVLPSVILFGIFVCLIILNKEKDND